MARLLPVCSAAPTLVLRHGQGAVADCRACTVGHLTENRTANPNTETLEKELDSGQGKSDIIQIDAERRVGS